MEVNISDAAKMLIRRFQFHVHQSAAAFRNVAKRGKRLLQTSTYAVQQAGKKRGMDTFFSSLYNF